MTIEYKDSKRIVGLSTDTVETLSFEDDSFSSGWTQAGTTIVATGGQAVITAVPRNAEHRIYKSLGLTVDNTKFILDFKINISAMTSQWGGIWVGLTDDTTWVGSNSNDFLGFNIHDNSGGTTGKMRTTYSNEGTKNVAGNSTTTISFNTDYYVRVIRTSATNTDCYVYSDSARTTLVEKLPSLTTLPSGVDGLTHIQVTSDNGGISATVTGVVDDIKLWSGVTSLTSKPTDVQDNSIFVETDTARRYWFDETGTTINFPPETTVTEFTTQGTPDDMVFSQDGLHLYTVDGSGALSLGEYTLQTAWDISTASHTRNKSFSYGSLSGVSINNDGTKIYVVDYTTQKCHELDLGTAYNISTAVDNGVFKSIGGSVPTGIHFKPDGTKAYVVDQNPDQLYQYSLSTAWNLSTLNTTAVATKSLSSQNPEGMIMNYAGTKIWVLYNSNDTAEEWTLQTAWDLSTATAGTTWDFSGVANTLSGGDTNPDDSTIYFLNSTGKVLEYPPTPATWTMQPTFEDGLTNYSSTSSSVDLTGSTLSDSWVFRFKLTMTAKSNGIVFMVQDNTSTTVTTPRDGIGLRQTDTTNYYDFEGSNNVGGNAGQYDHRFSSTAPALDTKYIQITRISATQAKIEFYDSTYTTVSETSGDITIANIDNLRYFVVSSNTSTFSIDDVEFYNGVTTIN
jgi:hypothetical protein